MLTLPAVMEINGLSVFKDDEDIAQFYYLPTKIELVKNSDGTPQFDFVVYDIGDDPEDNTSGGYLLFTVSLSQDKQVIENDVKPELQRLVRAAAPDMMSVPVAKIAPISFIDGTAELFIASGGGDLVNRIQLGKPSLFGDNTVSVIAEMPIDGAALFASVLEQGGSIATIEYNLVFEARLPSVVVTAHIEASRVREVISTWTEQEIKKKNTWGKTTTTTQRQRTSFSETLHEESLVELEIKAGSSEVDLSDDLVADLQKFAMESMDKFIQKEWLAGGILSEEQLASEWMESVDEDLQRNFDMSLTTRDVITRAYNPSAGVTPAFLGDDPKKFVTKVSIGDDFFKRLEVDVQTSLDFTKYGDFVHSVIVHMHYEGVDDSGTQISKAESFTFTAENHAPQKFVTKIGGSNDESYTYRTEVTYKGGPVEKREVDRGASKDRAYIASIKNPGEVDVTFNISPEVFGDKISSVEVIFEYADPRRKVKRFTEEILLNATTPSGNVKRPIFAEMEKEFSYSYVYIMDGGTQRVSAGPFSGAPDTKHVSIPTPFENTFALTVQPLADWNEMTAVIVGLSYEDDENDFRKSDIFSWDKDHASDTIKWAFSILDPNNKICQVSETWIRKTGGSVTLPVREVDVSSLPVLVVGDALGGLANLEVDAADIDFENDVRRVMINLVYQDTDNDVLDTVAFVFRDSAEIFHWSVAMTDGTKRDYSFDLKYFMKDGSIKEEKDVAGKFAGMTDFLFISSPSDN